jgi:hypothetical protein
MTESKLNKGVFAEVSDPDAARELEKPVQKPMATDPSEYIETGYLPMVPAKDGGVMVAPGAPPEADEGLTADNLVCAADAASGRPPCDFYVAFLTDADGVAKGLKRKLMQVRRFCTKLSTAAELMELGSVPVHACTARKPVDAKSAAILADFERRQRSAAEEAARTSADVDL